ncbi:MAG TPA: GHKL domain-containing protein [candidate division WOR-3 bacterium]|uniref:histidine kinase n=1 Tax=candidate division WOR-3 bacterium TaxID=2052148 RepID=A0A9C9EKR3_UNCW3|nr:GHKL domain-containing protein [candidate division WOR-3 bacterium]
MMFSSEFFNKRTGLIILHPLIVTFLLLSSYPIIYSIPTPFWFIILASFILAVIFLLLKTFLSETTVLYILFFSDIPLIGAMVHYSGGLDSIFPLLYVLLIILASLFLYRKGAYLISLCSVLFFLAVTFLESRGTTYPIHMIAYRFYIFGLLFLFTGILSGALSERYRIREEEAVRLRITTEEIIKNLPSGIITVDPNGTIVYTNIPEGPIRSRVHLHIAKFLENENVPCSIELKIEGRYYVFTCARIYKSKAGLGILQDYTDIRKLEEKSRISRQTKLLAELGGSLAHEIRNPLASIRGSLEVIREAEKDKNTLHFINMALKETNRLNEIVTDFLNFAQFVPVKKNRLNIRDVVSEALIEVVQKLNTKQINVKRKDDDFFILGDMNKLKSCLVNLINNAYEISEKGQVIEVRAYTDNQHGIIEILDHGKGIPEGLRTRIFDPFYTTKKGGTGLGLAITKNIVEAHNGKIEVESEIGEGSKFRIVLPLA